jgi:putative nucleotidyltransferase with HDIG domain
MKLDIPEHVSRVTCVLENAGYEAYIVGGCIRDLLLNRVPKDWDITTNATPEVIQGLFTETYYNNDFGTVGVVTDSETENLKVIEVTPYRTEGSYSNSRHPDSVEFGQSLAEDLKRRDFTINAIAYNPSKGQIIDLYKGQIDLKDKLIRSVGQASERFSEDALRMLRAIRLGAELGFSIEAETFSALSANSERIRLISKERVRDEFTKILLSERPMDGLFYVKHSGMLEQFIPELCEADGVIQNHSHKYDVLEHLLRSLQHAADKEMTLELRLAALFHDIGKPQTRRVNDVGQYTFYGHEVVGSRETRKILQRLKYPQKIVDKVVTLVRWHMFFSDPDKITLSAVRRMISNVSKDNIWDLLDLRICDRIGSGRAKEQPFRFRKYKSMVEEALRDPISVGSLAIDGRQLMDVSRETPGPRIGYILHTLLEEVLDEPSRNTKEYLIDRALELFKLETETLRELGEAGKKRLEAEENDAIQKIRNEHGV